MSARGADRAKAYRIRRKAERATPAEKKWLRSYDAERAAAAGATVEAPKPEPVKVATVPDEAPPIASEAPVEPGMTEIEFPEEPEDDQEDDWQEEGVGTPDGGAPPANDRSPTERAPGESPNAQPLPKALDHGTTAPAPTCGDPTCPACSKRVGGHMCVATGKIVWDPIDDDTAKASAMMVFAGVAFLVSLMRPDKSIVPATDAEIKMLGTALQKAAYRRLNALGAYDDLLMLVGALAIYSRRAIAEPAQ